MDIIFLKCNDDGDGDGDGDSDGDNDDDDGDDDDEFFTRAFITRIRTRLHTASTSAPVA